LAGPCTRACRFPGSLYAPARRFPRSPRAPARRFRL
jgi:hypothetical protein